MKRVPRLVTTLSVRLDAGDFKILVDGSKCVRRTLSDYVRLLLALAIEKTRGDGLLLLLRSGNDPADSHCTQSVNRPIHNKVEINE
jgi:hypothetical protein